MLISWTKNSFNKRFFWMKTISLSQYESVFNVHMQWKKIAQPNISLECWKHGRTSLTKCRNGNEALDLTFQNFRLCIDRLKQYFCKIHKTVVFIRRNILGAWDFSMSFANQMSAKKPYDDVEFDWIQLSADLDPTKAETFLGKWKRKFSENPFVPIGECTFCDVD